MRFVQDRKRRQRDARRRQIERELLRPERIEAVRTAEVERTVAALEASAEVELFALQTLIQVEVLHDAGHRIETKKSVSCAEPENALGIGLDAEDG